MKLFESDYAFLESTGRGEKLYIDSSNRDQLQRIWALRDAGLVYMGQELIPSSYTRTRSFVCLTDAGRDALAKRHEADIFAAQNEASAKARIQTAESLEALVAEFSEMRAGLEQTRQEFARYKADQHAQQQADSAQRIIDEKKLRRHEYLVAVFTALFTLCIEHIGDIYQFGKIAVEFIRSLLH